MSRPDRLLVVFFASLAACVASNDPAGPEPADAGDQATGGAPGTGGATTPTGGTGGESLGGMTATGGSAPTPADAGPSGTGGATADAAPPGSDPGSEGDGDVMIGPEYTPAPEYTPKPGVPAGMVTTFQMKSADSKFFPGLNGPFTRNVAVYVPKQYVPGTEAPFIIAQDGKNWIPRLSATLDNLIDARKLPVMVAIMIDNGGGDSKGSERGLEYDTVSGKYAEFVEAEVL